MDGQQREQAGLGLASEPESESAPDHDKDPVEQESLARDLAAELADIFAQYVRGDLDFAETSFATYDVLQDLHVVATGAYELVLDAEAEEEEDEDDEDEGGPSDEAAAAEQEELSGEPAR